MRRFFPTYHPLFLKQVEQLHETHRKHAAAEFMLAVLVADLNGHGHLYRVERNARIHNQTYKAYTAWSDSETPSLKLEVSVYRQRVKIELDDLPLDLAREVCALVQDRLDAMEEEASRE